MDTHTNHSAPVITCVSLGPGEAELITIKGLRALQAADLIYCPGTKVASRSNQILQELGIEEEKIVPFQITMSKDRSIAKKEYEAVAQEMLIKARQGKHVAIVAEGDSGFYSTARYITDIINADSEISLAVVPGVPAFIACGARAGIHVVKQEETLMVLTTDLTVENIREGLRKNRSMVVMKLSQNKEAVKEAIKTIPEAEFHYFENVGLPDREYYTADRDEIAAREIPYFSILIIKNKD
ncbi:precorrin-2 C(20)-methyltransferase [Porphyromonadaceae bacterium W3.11]|nr:precorrin-2 C(20)-methyltransferase [Porphyromonadaceae bacterium W3.11]